MATSPWEMFGGIKPRDKLLSECACPGCWKPATCWPHSNRNVRFCDAHATAILVATVKAIDAGCSETTEPCEHCGKPATFRSNMVCGSEQWSTTHRCPQTPAGAQHLAQFV